MYSKESVKYEGSCSLGEKYKRLPLIDSCEDTFIAKQSIKL
tara:strand:+ start:45 stop:167 length:123 start_codon:yes stop_codon:yes gene_type:complete